FASYASRVQRLADRKPANLRLSARSSTQRGSWRLGTAQRGAQAVAGKDIETYGQLTERGGFYMYRQQEAQPPRERHQGSWVRNNRQLIIGQVDRTSPFIMSNCLAQICAGV